MSVCCICKDRRGASYGNSGSRASLVERDDGGIRVVKDPVELVMIMTEKSRGGA